jgi:hypothetical protein
MTPSGGAQSEVLDFLSDAGAYPDRPEPVKRIDTHSAHVFLAGPRAYKVKRAIRYTFLDYSTLELRRQACQAEVRLNRRTAPDLYLGVEPLSRDPGGALRLGGEGTPVEWLVVMRRFPDEALLDRVAASGGVSRPLALQLADAIADFHARAVPTPHQGGRDSMQEVAADNTRALLTADTLARERVQAVSAFCEEQVGRHGAALDSRRAGGFVRQCHGDLHLRNIVLLDGRPTLFDAVEFNDAFACIDVWYDLAFLLMDLLGRGLAVEANVLFNRYLLRTSDLGGLCLVPLFLTSRAAIRAKTSLASASLEADAARRRDFETRAREYFALAERCAVVPRPRLIAVGGRSGAGKSSLAVQMAPLVGSAPGAVVIRSDVLRKVLLHHAPEERLGSDAYTASVTRAVYHALGVRAADVLASGGSVIADATFLTPETRDAIAAVAARANVPFTGLWLEAPPELMAERLRERAHDASDATADVLRQQLAHDPGPIGWLRRNTLADPATLARDIVAGLHP